MRLLDWALIGSLLLVAVAANAGTLTVRWADTDGYAVEVYTVRAGTTNSVSVPASTNQVALSVPDMGWIDVYARTYVDEIVEYAGTNEVGVVERKYGPARGPLRKHLAAPPRVVNFGVVR